MNTLAIAKEIAERAHAGQTDKVEVAYIEHPARVAAAVRDAGFDEDVQAVAWLHDVVEDSDISLIDLICAGIPVDVVDAVDAVTKRSHEPFADYYERVKANPMATAVKWHDVADNSRPDRLALVAPDTRQRLQAKYDRAREVLAQ